MIEKFSQELKGVAQREQMQGRINVSGMTNIVGRITKQTNIIDKSEYSDYLQCLKDQIVYKYPQEEAKVILNVVAKSGNKVAKEFDKHWLIFSDGHGKLAYYGFLKKENGDKALVGIYEFKVRFTLTEDIFIKRQAYKQKSYIFPFITRTNTKQYDSEEYKKRGITKQDYQILLTYSNLMEMEFEKIDF